MEIRHRLSHPLFLDVTPKADDLERFHRLREILQTMDVPPMRYESLDENDVRWLGRNIGVRNQQHPNFREAVTLVFDLQPRAMHVWYKAASRFTRR